MNQPSIVQLLENLESGELSSRELTEHFLKRIKAIDPEMNAFITTLAKSALEDALAADSMRAKGNEYLLMHEFQRQGFLIPDPPEILNPKSFGGGLILTPKKGIYSTIVLLLDYNAMYPSIIQ